MEPLENMVDMTAKLFECDRDEMYHFMLRLCSKFCVTHKKHADVYTHTIVFVKLHSWCEGQWMIVIVCRQYIVQYIGHLPCGGEALHICVLCVCVRARTCLQPSRSLKGPQTHT